MDREKHNCCPTHCCIEHGCKYGYEDCPVSLGEVKQSYVCEMCYHDSEYNTDPASPTLEQQEEHIEAMWEHKQNPRRYSPLEDALSDLSGRYGRHKMFVMLTELATLGHDMQTIIKTLQGMKEIR